ncbi:MAG TPA: type I restriction-modification enzyme R subunit C-terminal domain-containing protein [Nitrospiria bacterium]|nr:type I restriction-modification enzyme R subunit C-terminal domain-containing protein [Nitrospiria bacterium]
MSLVRFATHQENELVPFPERVNANFKSWVGSVEAASRRFAPEQMRWLEMIRDHVAANLSIDVNDFDYAPFGSRAGLARGISSLARTWIRC